MAKKNNKQFELLEHTGDIKIRAFGETKQDVYINAARAMMAFIYGDDVLDCDTDKSEELAIDASDPDALMVDWLSELLYMSNTYYRAYIDVEITQLTDTKIIATVGSCQAGAIDDIKAVTYHDLILEKKEGQWRAEIIFDI